MDTKQLADKLDKIKGKKIGVIGDLILDKFIFGDVERISPEAPVQVVLISKEMSTPGGSGNVLANVSALGGEAFAIGVVGSDSAGYELSKKLTGLEVDVSGIFQNHKRTIEKTRVIARSQHIVRIDHEDTTTIDQDTEQKVLEFIQNNIHKWDVVIISDYAKGFVTENIIREVIALSKRDDRLVVGDTKPKHVGFFKGVSLLAPNSKEAREISGVDDIKEAGEKIRELLDCNILVTQGSEGMTLFERDQEYHFPAKAREVFDVSGAGDTVMATLALCLAAGFSLPEATVVANHAAGIVVGKIGTATVSIEELKEGLLNNEQQD